MQIREMRQRAVLLRFRKNFIRQEGSRQDLRLFGVGGLVLFKEYDLGGVVPSVQKPADSVQLDGSGCG